MVLGGGTTQKLLQLVDVDVQGSDKLKMLRERFQQLQKGSQRAAQGINRFKTNTDEATDSAKEGSQQFGKMFGILMNIMFLGMAVSMVFGSMARSMLSMTGAGQAMKSALQQVLLPFFLAITPALINLSQKLMNLPKGVKMLIGAFVALMAVLGPILMIIGQIGLLFTSGLGLGMIATAAGVAAGALAILWAGFQLGRKVVNSIITVISTLVSVFKGVVAFLGDVLAGRWKAAFGELKNIVETVIEGIKSLFNNWFGWFTNLIKKIGPKALQLGKDIVNNIARGIESTAQKITDVLQRAFPDWAVTAFKQVSGIGITQGAANLLGNITDVNDFILTSSGEVLRPSPDDTIIGTKTPGQLGGGGGNVTVNINDPVMKEDVDVERVVDEVEERVNRDTRGRTGGLGT